MSHANTLWKQRCWLQQKLVSDLKYFVIKTQSTGVLSNISCLYASLLKKKWYCLFAKWILSKLVSIKHLMHLRKLYIHILEMQIKKFELYFS